MNTWRTRSRSSSVLGKGLASALLIVLCVLATGVGNTVQAADAANRQQAISMALRQNGGDGKVLGVQNVRGRDGRSIFAVKILSNGRVRVFRIPQAQSGQRRR